MVHGLTSLQFLDPLILASEVYKETRRRVEFLIAASSMKRKMVGFLAGLMSSSKCTISIVFTVINVTQYPLHELQIMQNQGRGE